MTIRTLINLVPEAVSKNVNNCSDRLPGLYLAPLGRIDKRLAKDGSLH